MPMSYLRISKLGGGMILMHEPEHEALESSNGFTQGTISLELLGAAATRGVLGLYGIL